MCLRNQAFQVRANTQKRKKLEVVLKRLAGDHLTPQQRQLICQAVGCREQYSFRLCQKPGGPSDIISNRDKTIVHRIFGDTEDNGSDPSAVLIRTPNQGGMSNTIYIYLPILREEKRDETQSEETSAQ